MAAAAALRRAHRALSARRSGRSRRSRRRHGPTCTVSCRRLRRQRRVLLQNIRHRHRLHTCMVLMHSSAGGDSACIESSSSGQRLHLSASRWKHNIGLVLAELRDPSSHIRQANRQHCVFTPEALVSACTAHPLFHRLPPWCARVAVDLPAASAVVLPIEKVETPLAASAALHAIVRFPGLAVLLHTVER